MDLRRDWNSWLFLGLVATALAGLVVLVSPSRVVLSLGLAAVSCLTFSAAVAMRRFLEEHAERDRPILHQKELWAAALEVQRAYADHANVRIVDHCWTGGRGLSTPGGPVATQRWSLWFVLEDERSLTLARARLCGEIAARLRASLAANRFPQECIPFVRISFCSKEALDEADGAPPVVLWPEGDGHEY